MATEILGEDWMWARSFATRMEHYILWYKYKPNVAMASVIKLPAGVTSGPAYSVSVTCVPVPHRFDEDASDMGTAMRAAEIYLATNPELWVVDKTLNT